jgi:hypothetical protein
LKSDFLGEQAGHTATGWETRQKQRVLPQTDPRAVSHVFSQALENEQKGIVDEMTLSQMKAETADN